MRPNFNKSLTALKTGIENYLNFKEFTDFITQNLPQATRNQIQKAFPARPKKVVEEHSSKEKGLSDLDTQIFQEIFTTVAEQENTIVPTQEFIASLRKDMRVIKLYPKCVMVIPLIEKEITVNDVLKLIEKEFEIASGNLPNKMEYMSWNQFMDYFQESSISKYSTVDEEFEYSIKRS